MRSYMFETLSDAGTLGFGGDEIMIVGGNDHPRPKPVRRETPGLYVAPGPQVPSPHDLERIRQAELKRARKVANQARGFVAAEASLPAALPHGNSGRNP